MKVPAEGGTPVLICHNGDLLRRFDPTAYGKDVADILALDGSGERLMPLAISGAPPRTILDQLKGKKAAELFPGAFQPPAALAGLYLYFSCFDEAHSIAQDIPDQNGSYWHAIVHRQEPDAGNSSYWFRRVGEHSVYKLLNEAAADIIAAYGGAASFELKSKWDPFAFIDYCDCARQVPGSHHEHLAREIQRAEWQLLFDYCARPRT